MIRQPPDEWFEYMHRERMASRRRGLIIVLAYFTCFAVLCCLLPLVVL